MITTHTLGGCFSILQREDENGMPNTELDESGNPVADWGDVITIADLDNKLKVMYDKESGEYLYSTDNGKTWHIYNPDDAEDDGILLLD